MPAAVAGVTESDMAYYGGRGVKMKSDNFGFDFQFKGKIRSPREFADWRTVTGEQQQFEIDQTKEWRHLDKSKHKQTVFNPYLPCLFFFLFVCGECLARNNDSFGCTVSCMHACTVHSVSGTFHFTPSPRVLVPHPLTMSTVLPLSRRPYDWFFILYFIMHIPISILVDGQVRQTPPHTRRHL